MAGDAETNPTIVTPQQLASHLSGNAFLQPPHPITLGSVSFPHDTEIEVDRNRSLRRVLIRNRHLQMNIRFEWVGGGLVGATSLADKVKSRFPGSPIWTDHIQTTIDCQFRHFLRWSPATSQQREWLEELIADFRTEFGWEVLREKLEAALQNPSTSPRSAEQNAPPDAQKDTHR